VDERLTAGKVAMSRELIPQLGDGLVQNVMYHIYAMKMLHVTD